MSPSGTRKACAGVCPEDGYPLRQVAADEEPRRRDWRCTNRWHPKHPGACPRCLTAANHGAATLDEDPPASYVSCGFVWLPQFEQDDLVRDERGGLKLTAYGIILAFLALLLAIALVRQSVEALA